MKKMEVCYSTFHNDDGFTDSITCTEEEEDLPSLLTTAEMQDDEHTHHTAPLPPTSTSVADISTAALTKVMDPNSSESFANLGGMNLLQQIEAGTGPEDEAVKARAMGLTHYPFSSHRDWDLARFLADSSLSQAEIDVFLKLDRVRAPCEAY